MRQWVGTDTMLPRSAITCACYTRSQRFKRWYRGYVSHQGLIEGYGVAREPGSLHGICDLQRRRSQAIRLGTRKPPRIPPRIEQQT